MSKDFTKKPCAKCPFRKDVKPFLRPERAEELAYAAENPYNTFYCHKTIEHNEEGEAMIMQETKICAGFLSMQHNSNGHTLYDDDGFEPSDNVYEDSWDMIEAYEESYNE